MDGDDPASVPAEPGSDEGDPGSDERADRPRAASPRKAARPGTTRTRNRRRRRLRIPAWTVPICVVAVMIAGEVGARVIGPNLPRKSGTEERAYVKADQMYDRSGPTEVVVLGSSETAGGIVPSLVRRKAPHLEGVYNAALAGTFLPTYREWARRVVIPALHPEVVVISMLPMTVAEIPATKALSYEKAQRAYSSAFDQITGGRLGSLGWRLRQRSALIRYRPYLRQPSVLASGIRRTVLGTDDPKAPEGTGLDWTTETDPKRVKDNTGPDGEVFDYHQQSQPVDEDPLGAGIYNVFARGKLDLRGIDAFVTWLRDHDIVPVILVPPVDRGPLERAGAKLSVLDGWTAALETWAREHDVPMHEEFTQPWDSDLFHDRNHLDEAGARRLSRVVGTWLEDLCRGGDLDDACAARS